MKRFLLFVIFLLASLVLQFFTAGWADAVIVDFFLVLVMFWGWSSGWKEGTIIGFFSGFLKDIFFSPILGINAFSLLLIGFSASEVGGRIYQQNIVFFTLMVALASLIHSCIQSLWLMFFYNYSFFYTFSNSFYPGFIYNCIVAFGVYVGKETLTEVSIS